MTSTGPSLATLRKLAMKKYRGRERLYLLEGAAAVIDALAQGVDPVVVLHDDRAHQPGADARALALATERGAAIREVARSDLRRISGLTTAPPVAAVLPIPENPSPSHPPAGPLTLACDRIGDPGNLGALIRAAAFYGVEEIWLGEGTVDPFNPKVLRGAMGSQLALRLCRGVDLPAAVRRASETGARVCAAEADGDPGVRPAERSGPPVVLLLGNEPAGLSPDLLNLAAERVAIERRGPVDSLNVAIAGAILLDRFLAVRPRERR